MHRRDTLRASKIMQERAFAHEKIRFAWNTQVTEVLGESKVEGLAVRDTLSGEARRLEVTGVFVAIGHVPNTDHRRRPGRSARQRLRAHRAGLVHHVEGSSRPATSRTTSTARP